MTKTTELEYAYIANVLRESYESFKNTSDVCKAREMSDIISAYRYVPEDLAMHFRKTVEEYYHAFLKILGEYDAVRKSLYEAGEIKSKTVVHVREEEK